MLPRLLVLAAATCCLAGCGSKACTLMGCDDGLRLQLEPKSGHVVSPGPLEVVVAVETAQVRLDCTFAADSAKSACTPTGDESLLPYVTFFWDARGDSILVNVRRAVPQIAVSISREGTLVETRTFTPKYEEVQPNGPECGPVCHSAYETWAVL